MRHLPPQLQGLRIPVVASPLFIISNPDLVIAQCKAGIVGSFPALNAREQDGEPILLCSGTTVTWAHHSLIHGDREGLKK
ncbi:MAG: hypothetical protein B7X55_12930, partial [Rhodobacterales bacterium 34-62-10]